MEIEYGELSFGINRKFEEELLVETMVETAERGGAERVLSLEADAKASAVELLDGEAEVTGKVNYRLLYLDKQHRLCGLDYFKDFKCRVKGEGIHPSGKYQVDFSVPDAEAKIDGDRVDLSAMLDVSLCYLGERAEKAVAAVGEAECKREKVTLQRAKKSEKVVELEKVADVGPGVKKIVLFAADALLGEIEDKDSEREVRGAALASVLYLNEADEVVELTTEIPFVETFDGAGKAEYAVSVKSSRIVLTDDEAGNAVEVEIALVIEEIGYEEVEFETVTTVCGVNCAVKEKRETLCERVFLGEASHREVLTGMIPLSAQGAYVAFVRPGCRALAEVSVSEGMIKVEGVSAFQVVYLAEGGYESVQGELPFAYSLPFAGAMDGQSAEVKVCITDAKATYNGKDLIITANVSLTERLYGENELVYLSDAEAGEPYPESEAGISVYFAEKGEDLWQIAKTMGVLPSALVKANSFLEEPLVEARKVLIFRGK